MFYVRHSIGFVSMQILSCVPGVTVRASFAFATGCMVSCTTCPVFGLSPTETAASLDYA